MRDVYDRQVTKLPDTEETERSVLIYAILLAGAFLVGVPAAYLAMSPSNVDYVAHGTLWIDPADGSFSESFEGGAPASRARAWVELLRSPAVLEVVVLEQRLYVQTESEHASEFGTFELDDQFAPGRYELRVDEDGEGFVLFTDQGAVVQRGVLGTPVGRAIGFEWTPSRSSFASGESIEFSVTTVADAARDLSDDLVTVLSPEGTFMRVALTGRDPARVPAVLNSVMDRFVELAGELRTARFSQLPERRSSSEILRSDVRVLDYAVVSQGRR